MPAIYTGNHSYLNNLAYCLSNSTFLLPPACRKIKVYQNKWAAWAAKKATVNSKIYEDVLYQGSEHITSMVTTLTESLTMATSKGSRGRAKHLAAKEVDDEDSAEYEEVLPVVRETEAVVGTYEEIATSQPRENRTRAQQTDTVIYNRADDVTERLRVEEGRGGNTSGSNRDIKNNITVTTNDAYAVIK